MVLILAIPLSMEKENMHVFSSDIEILGIDRYIKDNPIPGKRFTIKKKEVYARILVQKLL